MLPLGRHWLLRTTSFPRSSLQRHPICRSSAFSTTVADGTSGSPSGSDPTALVQPTDAAKAIRVEFDHGLPIVTVPLPSRNELCQFALRPISDDVAKFCDNLSREDKGIDYVAVHTLDGVRVAGSTSIDHLLQLRQFSLRINDKVFRVDVPSVLEVPEGGERLQSSERLTTLDELKLKVAALHSMLQVDEFKVAREQRLVCELERVELELKPLEEVRKQIEAECEQRSSLMLWSGFVACGVQMGVLFRLTYFEYSWDVVEPLSYFLTYSTILGTLGYYLMTRQSFDYPSACERVFSKEFYRRAAKYNFNVDLYNQLSQLRNALRHDLERLRDPLTTSLPLARLASLDSELARIHLSDASKYRPSSRL